MEVSLAADYIPGRHVNIHVPFWGYGLLPCCWLFYIHGSVTSAPPRRSTCLKCREKNEKEKNYYRSYSVCPMTSSIALCDHSLLVVISEVNSCGMALLGGTLLKVGRL